MNCSLFTNERLVKLHKTSNKVKNKIEHFSSVQKISRSEGNIHDLDPFFLRADPGFGSASKLNGL